MKAFNKKRKPKHQTKAKYRLYDEEYVCVIRDSVRVCFDGGITWRY